MNKVANLPASQRFDLFMETSVQRNISPAVVEKDFWVCWVLKHLFLLNEIKSKIVFKGGTTLSKVFKKIERFSEDIDLVLDWTLFGYGKDKKDPFLRHSSNTQQDRFNKQINKDAACYIKEVFCPMLQRLTEFCPNVKVFVDKDDFQIVNITYSAAFKESYLRPQVILEIGPLAAWIPSDKYTITPFAAEVFPNVFAEPDCDVIAIKAERTFWEKATILHQEAHRDGTVGLRYSRHYYDLYLLGKSDVKKQAFTNLKLLNEVREFKKHFYVCSWANYDKAKPGTFKLMPTPKNRVELQKDYNSMQVMIFGKKPPFEEILIFLRQLENEINELPNKLI